MSRVPPSLLPLLAVLALPGCFLFGECGFTPDGAVWVQSGLYEALPGSGAFAGGTVAAGEAPAGGLGTWDSPWGEARLLDLRWFPDPETDGYTSFWIEDGLAIAGSFPQGVDDTTKAALFSRFAHNVTDAGAPQVEAWASSFLASQTTDGGASFRQPDGSWAPGVVHRVGIGDRFRLEQSPVAGNGSVDSFRTPYVGSPFITWEGWTMTVLVPTKTWRGLEGGSLVVDAAGQAEYQGDLSVGEDATEYERRLRDRIEGLGLPRPEGRMELQGSIC